MNSPRDYVAESPVPFWKESNCLYSSTTTFLLHYHIPLLLFRGLTRKASTEFRSELTVAGNSQSTLWSIRQSYRLAQWSIVSGTFERGTTLTRNDRQTERYTGKEWLGYRKSWMTNITVTNSFNRGFVRRWKCCDKLISFLFHLN